MSDTKHLEEQKAILEAQLEEAKQLIEDLNGQLSNAEKANTGELPTVKIGKDEYQWTARSFQFHAMGKEPKELSGTYSIKDASENADLLKLLVNKKSSLLRKVNS